MSEPNPDPEVPIEDPEESTTLSSSTVISSTTTISSSTTPISSTTTISSTTEVSSSTTTTTTDGEEESSTTTPTTSSTTPTTAPTLTPTLTPIETLDDITTVSRRTTTSGNNVVTISSTTTRSSIGPTSTSEEAESKGFFDNTGAVAGVFSVVGLIGLAILIAVFWNMIRRRRARKFDREIAEAAREAAAAKPPAGFLDDEDEYNRGYNNNAAPGPVPSGGYPYSDASSHGTYNQQPMSHDSYGMREIGGGHAGPAPGEVYDYGGAGAAGAAGIGVARARSMNRMDGGGYGQALQEGHTPYAAFAAPTDQQHRGYNDYDYNGAATQQYQNTQATNNNNGQYSNEPVGTYDQYADLNRNKSVTSSDSHTASQYSGVPSTTASQYYGARGADAYGQPAYPPAMPQNAAANAAYQQQSAYGNTGGAAHGRQQSMGHDEMDAYGGYVVSDESPQQQQYQQGSQQQQQYQQGSHQQQYQGQQDPLSPNMSNPYDAGARPSVAYSDYEEPKRVLKVANE